MTEPLRNLSEPVVNVSVPRILIADGNPPERKMLRAMFLAEKFNVVSCSTPEGIEERLGRKHFDVVIVGDGMPVDRKLVHLTIAYGDSVGWMRASQIADLESKGVIAVDVDPTVLRQVVMEQTGFGV